MKLKELLANADVVSFNGLEDFEITGVTGDSRRVKEGNAFLCISGTQFDGHAFIPSAAENGAAVAIVEHIPENCPIPCVVTSDNRLAASWIFSNWFGNPQKKMRMIGVTGTNGKTSTTYMLNEIFTRSGRTCGVVGTIRNFWKNKSVDAGMTTPDPERLFGILAEMQADGVEDVFMEVSSHSLMLGRVAPIDFEAGIYTNLTPEHLDFHKTMEEYAKAKEILFTKSKTGIFSADNDYVLKASKKGLCEKSVTFGVLNDSDYRAVNVNLDSISSIAYDVRTRDGKSFPVFCDIGGKFSVYNTLGAVVCALEMGISVENVQNALKEIPGVPGRIERVSPAGNPFTVVVDYAHTPDAMDNIIDTINESKRPDQKLTVLFGCGGDRDRTKRPIMGGIAVRKADRAIITSDNSRSEDPEAIISEILTGVGDAENYTVIVDRREAIAYAVETAVDSEIVLIAGKGHENYEIRKDGKHPFNEREEVMKAIEKRYGK